MKVIPLILVACLACIPLWAAEVNGEWTAEIEGRRGGSTEITLNLKAKDGLVTGTVRGSRGEAPISAGTIDGDEISFSLITDIEGYQIIQYYRGTVEDDVIHFSLTVEDGRSRVSPVRDFEAKRIS